MSAWRTLLWGAIAILLAAFAADAASARLRTTPGWWDPDGVGTGYDWHYRVPVSIAAGTAANAQIVVNVNFNSLLSQMGVSGTFDRNSPRVVNAAGALVPVQEYNYMIYNGATNSVAGQGEVRFLLDTTAAATTTYYIYFDISQNGAKNANPQTPINGNFEQGTSAAGVQSPTNWTGATAVANFQAQVRPSESVSVTPDFGGAAITTDGTPNTGSNSYLIGYRNSTPADPGTNNAAGATLKRTITVPASNPGNLVFRYRPEGWDSVSYDYLIVDVLNSGGTVLATLVGPTTTANPTTAAAYNLYPPSPNYDVGGNGISNGNSGYGAYNYIDCDTNGNHYDGMTGTCGAQVWYTVTQSLAAWAGQTITLRFRTFSVSSYQSWYSIDDVEWSVNTVTPGTPQGFGVQISAPAANTNFVPGATIPLTVQVDAKPTAATNPVTVNLYDNTGALKAGPAVLTGSGATYTGSIIIPNGSAPASGWMLRALGLDASTSTVGATNGLVHISGQPNTPLSMADFWNIDESSINVVAAPLSVTKLVTVLSDPINGTTSPKNIPGATEHYCITLSNTGTMPATNVGANDPLPTNVTFVAGSLLGGTTCANAAATPPTGMSVTYAATPAPTISSTISSLAAGSSAAIVYNTTIN
ncbi:MAG: DUF11 domain-containing protein [Alphaproteobacteria bacterium]|nr:DUF11 domain-containing protein [Alphaproteobacteria bacterium]MDE2041934.1 DUF11 domain-containing protein [Alphaproteobacteria bacterium]MDE2340185.1 DUF11 domain-containing protein [Alphaproteobacteria bacterium]